MSFNGGMGNPAHTYAARARLRNFLLPFVNLMSRITPVAIATNHSSEKHLISNRRNPAHPLPSAVPSRPSLSLVRERRRMRACAAYDAHRDAVCCVGSLAQVVRVSRRSKKRPSSAMSAHTGLPASLRFCAYGVIRVLPSRPYRATQCGWVMPRRSPDLPTMSVHLPASLGSSEQSASCWL